MIIFETRRVYSWTVIIYYITVLAISTSILIKLRSLWIMARLHVRSLLPLNVCSSWSSSFRPRRSGCADKWYSSTNRSGYRLISVCTTFTFDPKAHFLAQATPITLITAQQRPRDLRETYTTSNSLLKSSRNVQAHTGTCGLKHRHTVWRAAAVSPAGRRSSSQQKREKLQLKWAGRLLRQFA